MSATAGDTGSATLAFDNARACKDWLAALPLGNIPQAQSLVLEALRALNAGAVAPLERLKCMELLRDKIAFLQGEQRVRYFGKTLPLSPNDSNAWTTGAQLLAEMERGYRGCWEQADADAAVDELRALVGQRVVRSIGALMLFHAIVYRRFELAAWVRLHALYADAEARGIAAERVKDSLDGDAEGASGVEEAYIQVVLLQAAYLSEMTAAQIDFAEALAKLWLGKVRIVKGGDASPAASHPLVVDLASSIGARPLPHAELGAAHRVFDVEALSKSLRRRIHALQSDEDPARLGLPPQAAGLDLLGQLRRLHRLWCEGAAPRPPAKASELKSAGIVFSLADAHFFVTGGKAFEQPGTQRDLTPQEKQDIEVFGRITERTQSRMAGDHSFTMESWTVVDEMPGTWRLQRPHSASKGVAIGRIAAIRLGEGAPFYLGVVRALVQETDGRIVATVALFPGKPEAIAVRSGDVRHRPNASWSQGFRLPAIDAMKVPSTLIVPGAMAQRGRALETWESDLSKEAAVQEIAERGADFDRVTTT